MDIQAEIKNWLRDQLDSNPQVTRKDLAQAIGIHANAITKMLQEDPEKEARSIHMDELMKMCSFFKSGPNFMIREMTGVDSGLLKYMGKLNPDQQNAVKTFVQTLFDIEKTE